MSRFASTQANAKSSRRRGKRKTTSFFEGFLLGTDVTFASRFLIDGKSTLLVAVLRFRLICRKPSFRLFCHEGLPPAMTRIGGKGTPMNVFTAFRQAIFILDD
jgi:hypothetical protein